ncbi:hypothetical protein L915_12516 [Phytophthora nicotianae]|uniref:Uncharacterized protein n=2 Tax=Phytophthora nicotianae TaxID=4792 RepID=W2GG71_PHYNI|nr:hypothetical protein L915_12516 [Phytophthora nicotianae]
MFECVGEEKDFKNGVWPFGIEGKPNDVPAPAGAEYMKINKILGRVGDESGVYSFEGQADTLPLIPGLEMKGAPILVTLRKDNSTLGGQLRPYQLDFKNTAWQIGIDKLVEILAGQFGHKGVAMQSHLSKFLIHGEGGSFMKRQVNKTGNGVIATLVIQLPSLYEGGDLVVYRGGLEKRRHDFGKAKGIESFLPHYVVIFADADYELEKVTQGYRLTMIYSIQLPPSMHHLARPSIKPANEDLAGVINTLDPDVLHYS